MKVSRIIWGWLVLAIGVLWMLGGVFGFTQGKGWGTLVLVFCGMALTRLGWNLTRN